MTKLIFPIEIVENSVEQHFLQHDSTTKAIYQIVLLFLAGVIASLWFIKVDINVRSTGILKPIIDRTEIRVPVSGKVNEFFAKENIPIKAGQVLLSIRTDLLEQQSVSVDEQIIELRGRMEDLEKLVQVSKSRNLQSPVLFRTSLYLQQYSLFKQQVMDADALYKNSKRTYDRYKYLSDNKAITAAEFEKYEFELQNAQNAVQLLYETQNAQCQTELTNLRRQFQDLNAKQKMFNKEKELYVVKAPMNGTIQQLKGLQSGSFITSGDVIAQISPDTTVMAEVFLLSKDVGLLKVGTPVRLQVDAFNYNEWGEVSGKVAEISNDVIIGDTQQPYFKVKCLLNAEQLKLKNGYIAKLKKGMTLQARFYITRQTLFQLLYHTMDDWLNPSRA
ncbi:HlyD family secretion protein [Solitalea koreensis]|uniref:HlyD family secretion protein n=1 Tax=Solitalea koreensis TaxID=543615 RepID=A0A521CS69_9SPHI|nr:HlyD family efflux transporter periplasmic adaptor subunit [Solitalea koreensis]SMO62317.1 HlyD family secretion protein [Solitalea koreensis]